MSFWKGFQNALHVIEPVSNFVDPIGDSVLPKTKPTTPVAKNPYVGGPAPSGSAYNPYVTQALRGNPNKDGDNSLNQVLKPDGTYLHAPPGYSGTPSNPTAPGILPGYDGGGMNFHPQGGAPTGYQPNYFLSHPTTTPQGQPMPGPAQPPQMNGGQGMPPPPQPNAAAAPGGPAQPPQVAMNPQMQQQMMQAQMLRGGANQ